MEKKLASMISLLLLLFLACVFIVVIEEHLLQRLPYQHILNMFHQEQLPVTRYSSRKSKSELINNETEINMGVITKEMSKESHNGQPEIKPSKYEGVMPHEEHEPEIPITSSKKEGPLVNNFNSSERKREQSPTEDTFTFKQEGYGRNTVPNRQTRGVKTILWYDTHWQSMVGHSTKIRLSECEYKNCKAKYIIARQNSKLRRPVRSFDADAVIVQSRAIFGLSPPPRRDKNQVFVLAVRDAFPRMQTAHQSHVARQWMPLFNYTMTYRFDSDFMYPYSTIVRNDDNQVSLKNYENIFYEKRREALWFVSHCKTASRREDYVKELRKELEVDIYGGCGQKAPCPKGDNSCFDKLAKQYKYYLAFENTLYMDYVTEKVFNWFNQDILIVVRGGSNYTKILPPGTYINSADFQSARHLGRFLKSLSSSKSEYIAYMQQKDHYHKTHKLESAKKANCELCEYLNTPDSHRKSYDDIRTWWLKNWRN